MNIPLFQLENHGVKHSVAYKIAYHKTYYHSLFYRKSGICAIQLVVSTTVSRYK